MRGRLAALTAATAAVVGLAGGLAGQAYAAPGGPAAAYCALGQHRNHPMAGGESAHGLCDSGRLGPRGGRPSYAGPSTYVGDQASSPALDAPTEGATAEGAPTEEAPSQGATDAVPPATAPTPADPAVDLRA
ncbi:hypothetical protein [Actinacidiphila paucisporea]|nr:hypothetical protein [Actinacidiphila paucisporea]